LGKLGLVSRQALRIPQKGRTRGLVHTFCVRARETEVLSPKKFENPKENIFSYYITLIMATRNLTSKFEAIKKNKGNVELETTPSPNKNIMDIAVEIHDKFTKNTSEIKEKVAKLNKIYSNTFFDSDESEVKKEQELLSDIKKKVKQNIQAVESLKKFTHDPVIKNIVTGCTLQLTESQKLIKVLTQKRQALTSDPDPDPAPQPGYSESMNTHLLEYAPEEVSSRERTQAIKKLAQDVVELNQLFKDLNNMIIDQGTILDRVDFNIEQANEKVSQGAQNVKKADEYQKKGNCISNVAIGGLICTGAALGTAIAIKKS
jgi:t-SNARE complex subunit (syntaxin)